MSNKVKTDGERELQTVMSLESAASAAPLRKAFSGVSSLKEYKKLEKAVKKELGEKSFLDPSIHPDLSESVEFYGFSGGIKRKARRFMLRLEYLNAFQDLRADQVRDEEADKDWIKGTLRQRIESHKTLEYPIFVTATGKIIHGHHRWTTWKNIVAKDPDLLNTKKIPVIVLSDPYFINEETGELEKMVGTDTGFNHRVSQIKPNKKQENSPYSMEGCASAIKKLMDEDKAMGGMNPGGKPFYDEKNDKDAEELAKGYFDTVMKELFEDEFSASKRTQIRKLIHQSSSVKVVHSWKSENVELDDVGWPRGKDPNKTNKRLDPKSWTSIDTDTVRNPNGDKKILHRIISTAGSKHKQEIRSVIVDMYQEGTLHEISGFNVLLQLERKTRSTVKSVNDRLFNNYIATQLTGINNGSAKVGWVPILSVRCSKELEDERDVGRTADWDATLGAFVWRDNGEAIKVMA
jgi:hypothetical protein